jgi:hypothetical protein
MPRRRKRDIELNQELILPLDVWAQILMMIANNAIGSYGKDKASWMQTILNIRDTCLSLRLLTSQFVCICQSYPLFFSPKYQHRSHNCFTNGGILPVKSWLTRETLCRLPKRFTMIEQYTMWCDQWCINAVRWYGAGYFCYPFTYCFIRKSSMTLRIKFAILLYGFDNKIDKDQIRKLHMYKKYIKYIEYDR